MNTNPPYNLRPNPRKSTKLDDTIDPDNINLSDDSQTLTELDNLAYNLTQPVNTTDSNKEELTPNTSSATLQEPSSTATTHQLSLINQPIPETGNTIPEPTEASTIPKATDNSESLSLNQFMLMMEKLQTNLGSQIGLLHNNQQQLQTNLESKLETTQQQIGLLQSNQQQLQTSLESKLESTQQQIGLLENNLNSKMTIIQTKLAQSLSQLEEKLNQKIEQNKIQTQEMKFEIMNTVQQTLNENCCKQNIKIKELETNLPKQIQQQTERIIMENCTKLEDRLDKNWIHLNQKLDETQHTLQNQSSLIQLNTNSITNQQTKLNQLEVEMTNLKLNPPSPNLNQLPEIIVNYIGEVSSHDLKLKLPHFGPKSKNPPEFLDQVDKYYEDYSKRRNYKDHLPYLTVVEQCFEGSVATWFQIIKQDLKNESDFKAKFLKQYWNNDIQRGIKRRIELEKYRKDGKMNRMEYFIEKARTLKALTPPMEETEIIDILSNHFDDRIRDSVKVQNIRTFERFIEVLSQEDMDERTDRVRQSNETNHHRPNQNTTYSPNRKPYDNRPSYERYSKFTPTRNHPYSNKPRHQYQDRRPYNEYKTNQPTGHSPHYNDRRYHYEGQSYQPHRSNDQHNSRQVNQIQVDQHHSNRYPNNEQRHWIDNVRRSPDNQSQQSTQSPKAQSSTTNCNTSNSRQTNLN